MGGIPTQMQGAILPGNSTVELRTFDVPAPGHGEVLLRMKAPPSAAPTSAASTTSTSAKGRKATRAWSPDTSPAGRSSRAGPGCRRFKEGDRVIVYHISGCGVCNDCRRGYMISCTSEKYRRAYGWQRDGGMADFLLAEEKDLVAAPRRAHLLPTARRSPAASARCTRGSRRSASAATTPFSSPDSAPSASPPPMLCRKRWARSTSSASTSSPNAWNSPLASASATTSCRPGPDNVQQVRDLTGGHGVERAVDCSANDAARATAIRATRKWGQIVMLGEGGTRRASTLRPTSSTTRRRSTARG